jgi:hypothetical protein
LATTENWYWNLFKIGSNISVKNKRFDCNYLLYENKTQLGSFSKVVNDLANIYIYFFVPKPGNEPGTANMLLILFSDYTMVHYPVAMDFKT